MTYLTDRSSQFDGAHAAWSRAVAAVAKRLKGFGRSLTRRKAIYDLSRLDDRMLSDIGVTRGDLQAAADWSLWRDPTDRLAAIAEERRVRLG